MKTLLTLTLALLIATPAFAAKPLKAPPIDARFSAKPLKAPPLDPRYSAPKTEQVVGIDEATGTVTTAKPAVTDVTIVQTATVRPPKAPPVVRPTIVEEPKSPPFGLPLTPAVVTPVAVKAGVNEAVARAKLAEAGMTLVTKEEAVLCDTCPAGYTYTGKTFTTAEPIAAQATTTTTTMACGNPDCTCEPGECPCPAGACPCGPVSGPAPAVCTSGMCGVGASGTCTTGTCGVSGWTVTRTYGEPTPAPLSSRPVSSCSSCGPVAGPMRSVMQPRGLLQRIGDRIRNGW